MIDLRLLMLPSVLSLPDPNATLEVAVAVNGLQPHILKWLETVDAAIPATLETASQAIGRPFAEASIPEKIELAIRASYETLAPSLHPQKEYYPSLSACASTAKPVKSPVWTEI